MIWSQSPIERPTLLVENSGANMSHNSNAVNRGTPRLDQSNLSVSKNGLIPNPNEYRTKIEVENVHRYFLTEGNDPKNLRNKPNPLKNFYGSNSSRSISREKYSGLKGKKHIQSHRNARMDKSFDYQKGQKTQFLTSRNQDSISRQDHNPWQKRNTQEPNTTGKKISSNAHNMRSPGVTSMRNKNNISKGVNSAAQTR
jgi:hypothetical protein